MLELLPPDTDPRSRIFQSKERLKGIEKFLPRVPIGSEDSTKRFRSLAVEDLLSHMFDKLAKEYSSCREKLGLKDQLVFTNHSNPLQDDNEEVLHRKLVNADQRAAEQKLPSSTKADRLCYTIDRVTIDRVHANDERQSILIVELKAPHKFSKTILQRGLRPMSVKDDVVNKSSIPTTPDEQFQHKAEELVAAGLAQAYTYMLQTGLEYGCLETGESTVFLRVDKDTPNTLFYHLAIPQSEVQQFLKTNVGTDTPFPSSLTALGQMSSFVLMALQSLPRPQDWRDAALKGAYVWDPDEEKALRQIPVQDAKPGVESPDFKSKASPAVQKSPYSFRKGGSSTSHQSRQYCTQLCLLGLVRGTKLDRSCPNLRAHRRGKKTEKHLLTQTRLCALIQKQPAMSLARGLTDLNLQGSSRPYVQSHPTIPRLYLRRKRNS